MMSTSLTKYSTTPRFILGENMVNHHALEREDGRNWLALVFKTSFAIRLGQTNHCQASHILNHFVQRTRRPFLASARAASTSVRILECGEIVWRAVLHTMPRQVSRYSRAGEGKGCRGLNVDLTVCTLSHLCLWKVPRLAKPFQALIRSAQKTSRTALFFMDMLADSWTPRTGVSS